MAQSWVSAGARSSVRAFGRAEDPRARRGRVARALPWRAQANGTEETVWRLDLAIVSVPFINSNTEVVLLSCGGQDSL